MYDLIVVGAGPAGSTAARTAALLGLDTLILEKKTFPRYKPCGGALSSKAASLLDFSLPRDICERTITGARVHFRNQIQERHTGYNLTTLITRSRFDHLLLQKAQEPGADIKTQKVLAFQEKGRPCVCENERRNLSMPVSGDLLRMPGWAEKQDTGARQEREHGSMPGCRD